MVRGLLLVVTGQQTVTLTNARLSTGHHQNPSLKKKTKEAHLPNEDGFLLLFFAGTYVKISNHLVSLLGSQCVTNANFISYGLEWQGYGMGPALGLGH